MVSKKKMRRVARKVVHSSFGIKRGDVVVVSCGPNSLEFAETLAHECSIIGAQPMVTYGSDRWALKTYKKIDTKFLRLRPKLAYAHLKVVDAEMHIDDSNPFYARQLPQWKVEILRKTIKPLRRLKEKKLARKTLRSALIGWPTKEKLAELGLG